MKVEIAFLVPGEWGGFLPTLPLAKALRGDGCRVTYLGYAGGKEFLARTNSIPDFIASEGFSFVNLRGESDRFPGIQKMTAAAAEHLESSATDLILAQDSILPLAVRLARQAELPLITLYTHFGDFFNLSCPPISSTYVPSSSLLSRARNIWEWQSRLLRNLPRFLATALRARSRKLPVALGFNGFAFIHKTRYGIVLGPGALDYPTHRPRVHFGQHLPADPGQLCDVKWTWPEHGQHRVYCSMGEYSHSFREGKKILRTLVEAFRQRPDLSVILQLGKLQEADITKDPPPNVHLYEWVSQQQALEQADLAVTSGGFGTVKECVGAGAVMLVTPFANDQFGNAARVRFHGLGLVADKNDFDGTRALQQIDRLLEEPSFAQGIATMRERIGSDRERETAETFAYLEEVLGGEPPNGSSRSPF